MTSIAQQNGITTQKITLLDRDNRRIALLSSQDGSPEFILFDREHRRRAALFLEKNGTPDLYLYDSSGKERLALDLYDSGAGNLAFLDAAGGLAGPTPMLEAGGEGRFRIAFHDFRHPLPNHSSFAGGLEIQLKAGQPEIRLIDASARSRWREPRRP